jgi:hypothetical protein
MDDQQTVKSQEDVHEEHAQQDEIIMQEHPNTTTDIVLYQGINLEPPLPDIALAMVPISNVQLPVVPTVQNDPNSIATGTSEILEVPDAEQNMPLFSTTQLWQMITQLHQSNQQLQLQLHSLASQEKGITGVTRAEAETELFNKKPIQSSHTPNLHEDMQNL